MVWGWGKYHFCLINIFCHFSVINIDGYKTLKDGQKVEFEVESDESKGDRATNVTPV